MKKKQSKEKKKENRKAKFEPNNKVSALDVKKERERAAELEADDDEEEDDDEDDDAQGDEHNDLSHGDREDLDSEPESENMKETGISDQTPAKEVKMKSKKQPNSTPSDLIKPTIEKQAVKEAKKEEEQEEEGEALSENEWIDFDDDGNALSGSPPPAIPAHVVGPSEEAPKPKTEPKSKSAARDPEAIQRLRDQLAARVKEMREKRKAPGTGVVGAPSSRDAILAARQQKKRKREPKQDKQKEESEEDIIVEDDDDDENNADDILFGSVQFKDGQKTTSNLKDLATEKKLKRRDLASQLRHVEAKKAKIAALDSDKRAAIEEKGQWSRAILQAEGTKIKDNEKLLKKSLKQQQQKKRKSEREWRERKETVAQNIANKQNKREKNLAMRKEMKGVRGKAQRAKIQKKLRAGFEGKKR